MISDALPGARMAAQVAEINRAAAELPAMVALLTAVPAMVLDLSRLQAELAAIGKQVTQPLPPASLDDLLRNWRFPVRRLDLICDKFLQKQATKTP